MIVLCPFQNPHPQNLGWTENSLRVLARVDRRRAVREGGRGRALEVAREGRVGIITIIVLLACERTCLFTLRVKQSMCQLDIKTCVDPFEEKKVS